MGADLIGYLVKGPVSFDEMAIAKAASKVQERNTVIQGYLDTYIAAGGDEADQDEISKTVSNKDFDDFFEWLFDKEGEVTEEGIRDCIHQDPHKTVVDFIKSWSGEDYFRDISSRLDPDDPTKLLVFAGEMSWGDEPQGGGYTLLAEADKNGVLEALGIR